MLVGLVILAMLGGSVWMAVDATVNQVTIDAKTYTGSNGGPAWLAISLFGCFWFIVIPYYLFVARPRAQRPGGQNSTPGRCQCGAPLLAAHQYCTHCGTARPLPVNSRITLSGGQKAGTGFVWAFALLLACGWLAGGVNTISQSVARSARAHHVSTPDSGPQSDEGGSANSQAPAAQVPPQTAPQAPENPTPAAREASTYYPRTDLPEFALLEAQYAERDGMRYLQGWVMNNTPNYCGRVAVNFEFTRSGGPPETHGTTMYDMKPGGRARFLVLAPIDATAFKMVNIGGH